MTSSCPETPGSGAIVIFFHARDLVENISIRTHNMRWNGWLVGRSGKEASFECKGTEGRRAEEQSPNPETFLTLMGSSL